MAPSSDYSCASVYSYHDHSPAPISPRLARRRLVTETEMSPLVSPEPIAHRMSVASGPKVRRYEDVSWDDDSWSRTTTMTGLSLKVKDKVKTRIGIKEKDALHAESLRQHLSTLPSSSGLTASTTATSSFSDTSSAQLQTVTSRHFFDSASAVSIALTSASNSSSDLSNDIETPHKSPTLLDPFDGDRPQRQQRNQQWPEFLSGTGPEPGQQYSDNRCTPKASNRDYRPTISQPFSFAVLSTPMSDPSLQPPVGRQPVVASASPNFSLISLADAQQRERDRSRTPHDTRRMRSVVEPIPVPPAPSSPQSQRLKNKKSGIMKFLNKTPKTKRPQDRKDPLSPDTGYRSTESSQAYSEILAGLDHGSLTSGPEEVPPSRNLQQPLLQLRPVSMNISRHLPDQYFAAGSPHASPSLWTLTSSAQNDDVDTYRLAAAEAENRLANAKKAHQLQVYELEAQVRELKLALEAATSGSLISAACENCGHERGSKPASGIMNRARVKTAGPRGVFGSGSLYEAK
jgi:hypothetical protein